VVAVVELVVLVEVTELLARMISTCTPPLAPSLDSAAPSRLHSAVNT
jgi:hypothetical protein